VPQSKRYGSVLKKAMTVLEDLVDKSEHCTLEKYPFEELYCCSELKMLRFKLDKSVFKEVVGQLANLGYLEVLDSAIRDFRAGIAYTINYGNPVTCSCGFSTKAGVPCAHEIKYMLYFDLSVLSGINPRWLVSYDEAAIANSKRKVSASRLTGRRK
jgi:hypothetical protein